MKITRVIYEKKEKWAKIEGDCLQFLSENPFKRICLSKKKINIKKAKILPVSKPSKIVMVGLNYKKHAKELKLKVPKEPIIFLKPPTAVIGCNQNIIYPSTVKRLDYEAELALVIKKKAHNVDAKKAKEYILGYTCCNDVTARDIQEKDGQWTRAKSFNSFCPIGPYINTQLDPGNLSIKSFLNGKIKQNSNTSDFIFPVYYLVSFISKVMTLFPGDIISTGTPEGVGPMKRKDTIEIAIDKIGCLRNKVI